MDRFTPKKRSEIMSKVRSSGTRPEQLLIYVLRKLKYKFRIQAEDLPGKPDAVIDKLKIAIFVHGCFWHSHAECPRAKLPVSNRVFWRNKIGSNRRRDQREIFYLRKMGWSVAVFWTCNPISVYTVENRINRIRNRRRAR